MASYGPQHVAGVAVGEILAGKYRVERVLGIGGMGAVVAAHHIHLDEKVAIKFLLREALADADAVSRFVREARAAVKIKSEHVARVIDVSTLPNGAPYIVMEYLEGGDLAQWLKERGALPIEQAVEFVLQAAVAVADAHALGIVHRDLKPANLFCVRRSDGQLSIKVLDFGISKITGRKGSVPGNLTAQGHGFTRTSALMGSPYYMSPEQMRSSKDVDAQTDIWALGVILFELMIGRPPFQADSLTQLAIKVANEPAPMIRSFRPDVPIGLEAVIATCLKKDPRQRHLNVGELALALLPFAPRRAKALVERISGILRSAGLSVSALAVPLSPGGAGVQSSAGTVPPLGRTTEGRGRRAFRVPLVVASVGLASVGLLFWGSRVAHRAEPTAYEGQNVAPSPGQLVVEPAAPPGVGPPEAVPVETLRPVQPTKAIEVTTPQALAAPKRSLPVGGPAIVASPPAGTKARAAPATSVPAALAAAAAKCDPPYYFDARGNRLFKKKCL